MKTVHVILCGNRAEAEEEYRQLREKMEARGYPFGEDHTRLLLSEPQEDEEYRFLTPDEIYKMLGLRIHDFEERGTAYLHPKITATREVLKRRIV